jgi:beta-mannanase
LGRTTLRTSVSVLATLLTGAGSALVAGVGASAAAPTVLTVSPSDDAYTSSGRRATSFGAEDKLVVGKLKTDSKVSFLKFTVPAGAAVTGARLNLSVVGGVAGRLSVRRVLSNAWTESRLTSGTAPALGLVVATAAPAATATAVSFDLGAEVTGPGTYSFAVQSSSTTAVTRFRSSENRSGRPELAVTRAAVSAPSAPVDTPTVTPTTAPTTAPTVTPTTPAATDPTVAPTTDPTVAPTTDPTVAPTTDPTVAPTTDPTVAPTTAPTAAPTTGSCVTGALLVPSCGVLWGAAAGGFTTAPRDTELKKWEALSGRTASIFHTYHKGDEIFPTKAEIDMTADAGHPRVLLANWKIAYGSTWAKVAAGAQDKRIDTFAARAKAYGKRFFLVLNHEPENDVVATAGSGMTAKDFAAMYRHTIQRLRADGVTNVVNVLAYMGNEKWMSQSWWKDLYPGDDVVDWIGLDSYVSVEPGYYHYGLFADLLDRKGTTGPGFYDWAVTTHRSKPIMIAEWGAYHRVGKTTDKSAVYASVLPELAKRPAIKAVVYFDTAHDDQGDRDISINSTASSLASFKKLAASPVFQVKIAD